MKVAFLDRDGVINKEVNYLHKIEDFAYTENCIEGLKNLKSLGFEIIIVTNQAGIARGYYTEEQYKLLTQWYLADLCKAGVKVLDVFHCPHHVNGSVPGLSIDCACRKPKAGMLNKAIEIYDIDVKNSILVGDKISDIEAGIKAGIGTNYLVSSGHCISLEFDSEYPVFDNLYGVSISL